MRPLWRRDGAHYRRLRGARFSTARSGAIFPRSASSPDWVCRSSARVWGSFDRGPHANVNASRFSPPPHGFNMPPLGNSGGTVMVAFTVNGKSVQAPADADTPPLWVLGEHLGLTRTA